MIEISILPNIVTNELNKTSTGETQLVLNNGKNSGPNLTMPQCPNDFKQRPRYQHI